MQRSCLASPPGSGGQARRGRSGQAGTMTTSKAEQPAQSPSVTALPGGEPRGRVRRSCLASPSGSGGRAKRGRSGRAEAMTTPKAEQSAQSPAVTALPGGEPRGGNARRGGTLRRTYRPSHGGRAGPPWGRGQDCIRHVMCRVYQRLPGLSREKFTKCELFSLRRRSRRPKGRRGQGPSPAAAA